jgi:WD40 repeat protein
MLARAAQPRLMTEAALTNLSGRIWSAIFSPDDRRVVTSDDRGARVWDAQSHQLLFGLPHAAQVYQAAYGANGTLIITAGMDGDVKVWSADSGALLRVLHHPSPGSVAATYARTAVSHRGGLVAAADVGNGAIHIWDVTAGSLVTQLPSELSKTPLISFSSDDRWFAVFDPSGPRLLVVTSTGDASIWAVPSGFRLKHLLEAGGRFGASAFSPDGSRVATSNQNGVISVWQTSSGGLDATFDHKHGTVLGMGFDRTSNRLVSAHADRTAVVSDIATGVAVSVLQGNRSPSRTIQFDSIGMRIIAGSWDGTAYIWDTRASYRHWGSRPIGRDCGVTIMPDDERRVIAVSCSAHLTRIWDSLRGVLLAELPGMIDISGDYYSPPAVVSQQGDLVAIPRGNRVELYRLTDGRLLGRVPHAAAVSAVAFSPDGHTLASGSIDGAMFITRGDRPPVALARLPGAVEVVGILADGRVVAADQGGRLRFYDHDTYAVVADLENAGRMRAFRPSVDGRRLVTVRYNKLAGPALLWNLDHYRRIAALGDDKTVVFSARFEHDDLEIMTASSDGVARKWNGVTGQLIQSYVGTPVFLTDAATSPDGTLVATAGGDGLVRFWSVSSGAQLWSLPAHADIISSLHFDGADLVTRGFAGDIARWTLPALPSRAVLDSLLRCLPIRFDEETGMLVEQAPCERPLVRASGERSASVAGSR